MLEAVSIRNIATYNEKGVSIDNLNKINFIYGCNGSGKTTITKYLHNPSVEDFRDCSLVWKNNIPTKILVYNKDFRDRNFEADDINGIFTLGEATKEELDTIENKQQKLAEIKDNLIQKKQTLDKLKVGKETLEIDFQENVWVSVYKKHENKFIDAFKGYRKKSLFKDFLLEQYNSYSPTTIEMDDLLEKAEVLFGEEPKVLPLLEGLSYDNLARIEKDPIWRKKIVGKDDVDISNLILKLNINDWVNEGREYLQDNEICPFCQQRTVTQDFRNKLENFFDESFLADIAKVKKLREDFMLSVESVTNHLKSTELIEKSNKYSKLDIELFEANMSTLSSQIFSCKELITNKVKEPSRSVDFLQITSQIEQINRIIEKANERIKEHNQIANNYLEEKLKLKKSIWKFLIQENREEIGEYFKKIKGQEKGINSLREQFSGLKKSFAQLEGEIIEDSKNVTSVQPSVNEINKILKSYGFQNFRIVPSSSNPNQYQIQREDGTLAKSTLSEGEVTFITFLYFLQLAKGGLTKKSVTEDRILVIDDPISSLDSNVLFVVSSLVKRIVNNIKANRGRIKQVILLTHNVYFHKEVSFIDGRTKECQHTSFWILRKQINISSIQNFARKNPIQTSYGLLWQELKDKDRNSGITVQNVMRRIIENYFKILGKYKDDDLIRKFTDLEEQEICRSLISWVNDGSHSLPDDLFIEHQDNIIDRYLKVFKQIFEITNHIEHYKMMMGEEN